MPQKQISIHETTELDVHEVSWLTMKGWRFSTSHSDVDGENREGWCKKEQLHPLTVTYHRRDSRGYWDEEKTIMSEVFSRDLALEREGFYQND